VLNVGCSVVSIPATPPAPRPPARSHPAVRFGQSRAGLNLSIHAEAGEPPLSGDGFKPVVLLALGVPAPWSSVDINDHELTAGCLIISPAALMQSSPFDHDGRAPHWQGCNVNRRSADCSPRCTAGNTGDTNRRQGSADTRLSFRLQEYPAVK
jgi:hypothetical protein